MNCQRCGKQVADDAMMFRIEAGDNAQMIRKRNGREGRDHGWCSRSCVANRQNIGGFVAFRIVITEAVERDQDDIRTFGRLRK